MTKATLNIDFATGRRWSSCGLLHHRWRIHFQVKKSKYTYLGRYEETSEKNIFSVS
jgi:hypothetical protein